MEWLRNVLRDRFSLCIGGVLTVVPGLLFYWVEIPVGVGFLIPGGLIALPLLELTGAGRASDGGFLRVVCFGIGAVANVGFWTILTALARTGLRLLPVSAIAFGLVGGIGVTIVSGIWRVDLLKLPGVLASWMVFGMAGPPNALIDNYIGPAFAITANVLLWAVIISIWMLPIVGVPRRNEPGKE